MRPQLDSPEKLETLGNRLMYRLVYRNFGDHESLVVNHTVGTETGSAALRWYELRSPGAAPVVHQQGTYAPDSNFRWMGSMAMDKDGNIALGYSKSSAAMYPSIAATGRLAGDPLGTMGAEDVLIAGSGSQIESSARWGDYSTMSIDPADDCTFWYTQEYYTDTSSFDFKTRIGAMRFPSCTSGPSGALEGTVTSDSGPIAGATVTAGESETTTDAAGHYQFLTLPAGTYDVTASSYGYMSSTAAGVTVAAGATTVQDFTLENLPSVLIVGTVRDSGHGWPLYARLVVSGPAGFPGATLYNDPVSGYYSISLAAGFTYDFAVTSLVPGYVPGGGPLTVSAPAVSAPVATVANWTLAAAPTCTAPGYGAGAFVGPLALSEGFDGGVIPPGWTVQTLSGVSWKVYTGGDPCFQFDGNRTGGSGPYAIVNSGCETQFTNDDTCLLTPPLDLSGRTSAAIQWANDYIVDEFLPVRRQRGRERRRGSELDERLAAAERLARPGSADRRHVLRGRARERRGALSLSGLLLAVVAGGRRQGRLVRVCRDSRRPGRGIVSDGNTGLGLTGAAIANLSDGGSTTPRTSTVPEATASIVSSQDGGSKTFDGDAFPRTIR